MKLPSKIQIIDSPQSVHSRLRFGDNWEGYDIREQVKQMAFRFNELIDYLNALPQIPNEAPLPTRQEGDTIVHEHEWIEHIRFANRAAYECRVCGETMEKILT